MIVIALDPGNERTAWVVFNGVRVLDHGIDLNAVVVSLCRERFRGVVDYEADLIACEMIASYGMPVGREVFDTCVWIGRFWEAHREASRAPWRLVYRREVKLELCGSPRAKDGNVRQALLDRIGPRGTKREPGPTYGLKADEWAALGVAVVAHARPVAEPGA